MPEKKNAERVETGGPRKLPIIDIRDTLEKFKADYLGMGLHTHPADKLRSKDPLAAYASVWDLFQEMKDRDPQVSSLYDQRRNAVLAVPINVVPASEDEHDIKVADSVKKYIVEAIDFDQYLYDLLAAMAWGFSISQISWDDPDEDGFVAPVLYSHPQNWFVFDYKGNPRLLTEEHPMEGEEIPQEVLDNYWIVHKYNADGRNPWGRGFLVNCFWTWMFKKACLIWWLDNNQTVARQKTIATGEFPDMDDALEKLNDLHSQGIAVLNMKPEDFRLDTLGGNATDGTNSFQTMINECDEWIAKAIYGQTLTSEAGTKGSGSYKLGEVHRDTAKMFSKMDARLLENSPLEKLVGLFVKYNFGEGVPSPKIEFIFEEPLDEKVRSEVYGNLRRELGFEEFTREGISEEFNIPLPTPDQTLLVAPEPQKPFGMFGEEKKNSLEFAKDYGSDKYVKIYSEIPQEILDAYGLYYTDIMGYLDDYELTEDILTKGAVRDLKKGLSISPATKAILAGALATYMLSYYAQGQYGLYQESIGETAGVIMTNPWSEVWGKIGDRMPVLAEEFYAPGLMVDVRSKMFTVAGVEDARVLGSIRDLLDTALKEGQTGKWFKDEMKILFDSKGLTELNPWHIQTVYRNNSSLAYNAGIWTALEDDDVVTRFDIGDDRVRDTHRAVSGMTARKDDPIWLGNVPPYLGGVFEHRCRCGIMLAFGEAVTDYKDAVWGGGIDPFSAFIS